MTVTALPRTTFARWLYALKPGAWPKLLVPMLLGQAVGVATAHRFSVAAFAFGLVFTMFGAVFILLLNDWGDRDVDTLKRSMFPESCSAKTIPDGILTSDQVLVAALLAAMAAFGAALVAQLVLGRPQAGLAAAVCMALFVAYSLPPLELNYRGGGEILETLGAGITLPLFNTYLQSGNIAGWPVLAGFAALSLASATASGLSDEESDRLGGKHTVTSTLGNVWARRITESAVLVAALLWLAVAGLRDDLLPGWALAVPLVFVLSGWLGMRAVSNQAVTNAFAAHQAYKRHLHRAAWLGGGSLAIMLVVWGLM